LGKRTTICPLFYNILCTVRATKERAAITGPPYAHLQSFTGEAGSSLWRCCRKTETAVVEIPDQASVPCCWGYYTDDGRLHYAGRSGTGMTGKELKRLASVLAPLHVAKMPLAEPPPRDSRFGSLKLSRVHWVRPKVVVEVTYLTWTQDNLLRQVSYQGQREDKTARQVVRPVPHPIRR
jgi:hypothetical protein